MAARSARTLPRPSRTEINTEPPPWRGGWGVWGVEGRVRARVRVTTSLETRGSGDKMAME